MSTSMCKITIKEKDGNRLSCHYEMVYFDNNELPEDKVFPFQIILELYDKIKNGYIWNDHWEEYPFNREEAAIMFKNHPAAEKLDQWLEIWRGQEVAITPEQYKDVYNYVATNHPGKKIGSYGSSNGQHHVHFYGDNAACVDIAEEEILEVEIENTWNYPREEEDFIEDENGNEPEEGPVPGCEFSFTVADENILFHCVPGCMWESTMYNIARN